ncbi:hypothetical protein E1B28_013261 [Marasmius oreades]|uniref:Arrestin C-terminal-like domain-containing protein n=1 Tax=Marasmius oreades TaxID=181124 RepID=A0A9P7RQM3_9AGAR|nr:uncharacterized protein E1B28_013261 [Marasmius oreades]KAG7087283.1 hypothetical protein E1B28_013261 [Marasmius oreades]
MPPSITSTAASSQTRSRATKKQNTLSILLAESAVFLRTNDATGRNRYGDSQPSIVRGLLVLDVVKPMKISAIELELIAKSVTAWPEGVGAHRTDITEAHRVFEVKEVAWAAAGYTGSRPNSRGKRTTENFQMETVEEDQLDLDEPQPPSYTQSETGDSVVQAAQLSPTPTSLPFQPPVTPSASSVRTSISTASTSLSSAFTMTPSTSATSASSTGSGLLASVKPFEDGIPKTHPAISSSQNALIPPTTTPQTTRINSAGVHTISRPPPFDDVPEYDYDNNANTDANPHDINSINPNPSVPFPHPSTRPPEPQRGLPNNPKPPLEAREASLPLLPNRPASVTSPTITGRTQPTPNANVEPESDSRGRTKKRKFSIFYIFESLFGSRKRKRKEKGKDKQLDPQIQGLDENGRPANYREGTTVAHSRSKISMKSSGGATVGSEDTIRPKERTTRPSSFFAGKRGRKTRSVILPPLPPPPAGPPPVPTSSATSVRSAPLPLTSLPRQSFSSATNRPDPPSSNTSLRSYASHPYAYPHSTSNATPSPASSTVASSAIVTSGSHSISGSPSARSMTFMGISDILRDRDHRSERRRSRGSQHGSEGSIIDLGVKEDLVRHSSSEEPAEGPGWKEFGKGTYTYPITLRIPGHAPPTLDCTYGSVTWRIKGVVKRHGAFSSNLTMVSPLLVISCPAPLLYSPSAPTDPFYGASEENIVVERHWEDQLHYSINVSGRSFHTGPGSTIGVAFTFVPLCRGVRVWRVGVSIEEKTEYLTQFRRVARTDPVNTIPLLSLRDPNTNAKEQKWLLPLPEGITMEESPLKEVLGGEPDTSTSISRGGVTTPSPENDNEGRDAESDVPVETKTEHVIPSVDVKSQPPQTRAIRHQQSTLLLRQREETLQSFQAPHGPWSFHTDLPLPASCGVIRASNRNRRSNMNITHTLKCVVRVERGDDSEDDLGERKDAKKRKLFDIVIQTPVQILSCRCSPEYISLPHYEKDVEGENIDPGQSMLCPCQRYSNSVRELDRPPSRTGSTWSGKKRESIGSGGDKGGYNHKRSSISSIASIGSGLLHLPPPSPLPLSPHVPGNSYPASRRSSLAFSVTSGASTTAFSTQNFSPASIPADTLAARNKQIERLISGAEWEDGRVVPTYEDVRGRS